LPLSACCCFAAQEIRELWMEYEENASLEAKVVKDFDKVQFHISISWWHDGNVCLKLSNGSSCDHLTGNAI